MDRLKNILDRFYREYNFDERILHDPVEFPLRYKNPADIEVSGFIASCLAYGKVEQFKPVVERLLSPMGSSPFDFLVNFDPGRHGRLFEGVRYRFNESEDILCLLFMLHRVLKKYGSLQNVFISRFHPDDRNIERSLSGLISTFLAIDTSEVYGKNIRPRGLVQFFPSPANGSACKRASLFLRWMIRDRDIDPGIWKGIPKDRLVIPLDTHIARISMCLGLTERKSRDWKTAVGITEALKKFDHEDPLKYDFALCHQGISGLCKGRKHPEGCPGCVFRKR